MGSKSHRVASRPHFTKTANGALPVPGKVRMEDSVKRSKRNDKVIVVAQARMLEQHVAKLNSADRAAMLMRETMDRINFG